MTSKASNSRMKPRGKPETEDTGRNESYTDTRDVSPRGGESVSELDPQLHVGISKPVSLPLFHDSTVTALQLRHSAPTQQS